MDTATSSKPAQKDFVTAALLSFFLGGLGIWAIYDFIMIVLGKPPDANGQPLKR